MDVTLPMIVKNVPVTELMPQPVTVHTLSVSTITEMSSVQIVTANVIPVMTPTFVKSVPVSELIHLLVTVHQVCIHHLLLMLIMNSVLIRLVLMMVLVNNVLTNVRLVTNSSLVIPVLKTVLDFPHLNVCVKMVSTTKKVTQSVDHVETNV